MDDGAQPAAVPGEGARALAAAVDVMFEGLQLIDRQWRYVYVNQTAARHGRATTQALVGRTMMACYPGIEDSALFTVLRQAMEEGQRGAMENQFTYPDGTLGWFEIVVTPVPEGIVILSMDISQRKRMQDELQAAELLRLEHARVQAQELWLRGLLDSAPDAIVICTRAGRIVSLNRQTERLFGHRREQLADADITVLVPPTNTAFFQALGDATVAGPGGVLPGDFHARRGDGGEFPVEISLSCVETAQGTMVMAAFRDVTERRRAQQALAAARDAAEFARGELEAFSYSVAHDLRAPLRAIDGFTSVLLDECGDRLQQQRPLLDKVRRNVQHMAQLIEDLLMLARVSQGEVRRAPVDLTALAHAAFQRLRSAQPERAVAVTIAPGLMVDGDPRLLAIALENLIDNAWKFTGKTAAPTIEVSRRVRGQQTVFVVADNGAGFDMAYKDKLFGVFARLHPTSAFEGTGIGLATVQRIIRRHGGQIWAEAAVGRGATFFFTVPPPSEVTR